MNIQKTQKERYKQGVDAENYIEELANKAFFKDWCFKNPRLPNGKELCDLLVVFDDVVIIFQVKSLKLHEDTGKYNKSDVEKNIKQLGGAKNKFLN
ncbi:MAG: hypothetical protein LBG21_04550 [Campylobacteraceae bacterium]|jgi:hypothetical protein|nr:hypothetical protein [Campylobacteraceae bacterium]